MMNDGAIPRYDFVSANVEIGFRRKLHWKTTVDVVAARWNGIRLGRLNDHVRAPAAPGIRKSHRTGQVARCAFRRSVVYPLYDRLDFFIRETALALENTMGVDRLPRRHFSGQDRRLDRLRPGPDIGISQQR